MRTSCNKCREGLKGGDGSAHTGLAPKARPVRRRGWNEDSRSRFVRSLALASALAALPVVALPGFASAQTAPSADGITVYNAQHASLTKEWVERFTRETGIKVTVRNGSDMELGNQIVQEGAASPPMFS